MKQSGRFLPVIMCVLCSAVLSFQAAAEGADTETEHTAATENTADADFYRTNADILKAAAGFSIPEAPPSLFEWQIGSKEVELFSSGTWEMQLANGGLRFGFSNGAQTEFQAPVFTQTVDFTLSLMMDKRWYFETSFADNFDKNTFAAGYHGRENDIIQEFRIGNCGLFFPDIFTFVSGCSSSEEAGTNTWGLSASFLHDNWEGWIIAKLENSAYEEKNFLGTNEISETDISVNSYIRGKWFYIPEAKGTARTISVYVESASGTLRGSDGRLYRKLNPAEYLLSASSGILTLRQKTQNRVAVVCDSTTAAVEPFIKSVIELFKEASTQAPAIDISGELYKPQIGEFGRGESGVTITIENSNALLVYVPGYFNPLSVSSLYASPGTYGGSAQSDFSINWTGTGTAVNGVSAAVITDDFSAAATAAAESTTVTQAPSYIEVASTANGTITDAQLLFPLTEYSKSIYLPGSVSAETLPVILTCNVYTEKSVINLGSDVSPSSITVYRGGIQDTSFTFDAESGNITLLRAPSEGENIKITFSRVTAESQSTNLFAAAGVQYQMQNIPEMYIKSAGSFLWNISADGYADETSAYPGSVILSAETSYTGGTVTAGTAVAGGLHTDNSTGWYRILGMDSDAATTYHDYNTFYAVPHTAEIVLPEEIPTSSHQMPLTHRTTVITDSLGKVSAVKISNIGDAPIETGADSPYAASDGSVSGFVMVMEWEGSEEIGTQWAGAEIHALSMPDCSQAQKLEIALQNPAADSAAYDVYIQLGITDDDTCKALGIRTTENSDKIRSWKVTGTSGNGVAKTFKPSAALSWQTVEIILTGDDRKKLTAGNGIRIIAVSTTGTSGALAVGPIASHGSPFTVSKSNESTAECSAWITADPAAGTQQSLSAHQQSFIVERFNSAAANRVLCIAPVNSNDQYSATCKRYFKTVDTSGYKKLGFFFYADTDANLSGLVTVEMGNGQNQNVCTIGIPLTSITAKTWNNIEYDITQNTVAINGSPCAGAVITAAPLHTEISYINITISEVSCPLYFDEWYLSGISPLPSIQNKTWFTWKQKNTDSGEQSGAVTNIYVSAAAEPGISWDAHDQTVVASTSSVQSGATIFGYTVKAGSVLYAGSSYAEPGFSHAVSGSTGAFAVTEEYDINTYQNTFRRNFSAGWNGTKTIPVSLRAATAQSGSTLVKSTKNNYTIGFTTPLFKTTLNALFGETVKHGDINGKNYGTLWIDTWQTMIHGTDAEKQTRTVQCISDTSIIIKDASVNFAVTDSSKYENNTKHVTENTRSAKLSIPFTASKWNITPYYEKTAIQKVPSEAADTWQTDITQFAGSPPAGLAFWTSIPFYELFTNNQDTISESGEYQKYTALFGLQWSRPITATIADFFIPGTADIAAGRTLITQGTGIADTITISAKASGTALNIFGTYGAVPVFQFYTQDEFYQMYSIKTEFNSGYFTFDLSTYHSVKLIINSQNSIQADNTYIYSKTQNGTQITQSGTSVTVPATWKETFSAEWTHSGKISAIAALLQKIFKPSNDAAKSEQKSTFTSPYWQTIRAAPIQTIRKETLTVITGSSSDMFFNAELKHRLEAVAAYVTVSADIAAGIAHSADNVTTGTLIATLGCKIQF